MVTEKDDFLEDVDEKKESTDADMSDAPQGGQTSLADRDMSGFPVSIGTGLALETIFDPIQEVVDDSRTFQKLSDRSRYSDYLINISTLIRNMLSSVSTETMLGLPPGDVLDTLVEEMEFLKYLFSENGLNVSFYANSYSYFIDTYPDQYRKPTTKKQHYEKMLNDYCLKEIDKHFQDVKHFNNKLRYGINVSALVLTHIPADLLSYDKFRVLDLLESHTGVVKTREAFNTKYYPIPRADMSFLPFFEYLLVTFGDKVMFKPSPIKKRQEVLSQLERLKVHPLMTEYQLGLQFTFG